jgi:hypothetical protein
MKKSIFILIAIMLFSSPLFGQTLIHKRLTVSSGGGLSSDGTFTNQVVIGQTAFGESSDSLFFGGGGFLGGGDDWITSIDEIDEIMPLQFELSQNYPNPFNPSTTINYTLAEQSHVRLEIYNILGQRVTVIIDENQEVGSYSQIWQAGNVPSGVYFYRIKADEFEQTRKMMLLK